MRLTLKTKSKVSSCDSEKVSDRAVGESGVYWRKVVKPDAYCTRTKTWKIAPRCWKMKDNQDEMQRNEWNIDIDTKKGEMRGR